MPVDMNTLFRERGIQIEHDGNKGVGVPFSAAMLEALDREDLNAKTRQRIVAGDMLIAVMKRNENGEFERDQNGRPVRSGGYLKLGADNELSILVPRADEPGEFTRVPAQNTRRAAAQLLRMQRDARQEVARIEREHAEAMARHEAALARNEESEVPVLREPRHQPAAFDRFTNFIDAVESVIRTEVGSAFASAEERRVELMSSLEIRNERRQALTSEQMGLIAQAESLREQIARIAPDHPLGQQAIVAPYFGDGEALSAGVMRLHEVGAGQLRTGVPSSSYTSSLVAPLMATFTRTNPDEIRCAALSTHERRRFEQLMARHENEEIADTVRGRVEAIMATRMPDYTCAVRFFAHQGVDYLMVNDLAGTNVYAAESAARTMDLDIERLNRVPTEADVPSEEQIAELRNTLAELSFDNGADVDFVYADDIDEEDLLEGPDLDDEEPEF